MTEVCSLSSGLYEIAKMSGTTKDDSGRTLLRTWRQVKKISTEIYVELCVEELRNKTGGIPIGNSDQIVSRIINQVAAGA